MSGLTAAVLVAVLVGTLAQSVSGLGFALVAGPLLVAALGPADGVRMGILLALCLNLVLSVRHRGGVDRVRALQLFVPSALTLPVWALLLRDLPPRPAGILAGVTIIVGVLLLAVGVRWPAARGRAGAVAAGVASSATTVVASVAGPPVALWAANADWEPDVMRATLQTYFLGINVVALLTLGLPDVPGALLAGCLATIGVGLLLGGPLARRLSGPAARQLTLALAGAGGVAVLVTALR